MLGLSEDSPPRQTFKLPLSRRPSGSGQGTATLPNIWISPRRLFVLIVAVGATYLLLSSPAKKSTVAVSMLPSNRRPSGSSNSGWVHFDSRIDSPFLPRHHNTAPPTRQELRFNAACRDQWISRATLCADLQAGWRGKGPLAVGHALDVVYTWQNGSDPVQVQAREDAARDTTLGSTGTGAHHYRDHDELKYSLRSLFKAFSKYPDAIGKVFVYTSDLPTDYPNQRIGAMPKWLDILHPSHFASKLQLVFPWQTFKTPAVAAVEEAMLWRDNALPTFQSMAVESQFANIDFDEYMLYSCDDFFLFNDLSPSDAYTPLFGPNFRLRTQHKTYKPIDPDLYTGLRVHERLSLTNSAFVIGKRFGNRNHRYIEHVNKIYNKPLLQEAQSCFAEELALAAQVKLRGRGPDLNIHSLFIHFVIERHREALLWSALVAKADSNADGSFDADEFGRLLEVLGGTKTNTIKVPQPRRSINTSKLLKQAGLGLPLQTRLDFTSMDGYSLMLSRGQKEGIHSYPKFHRPGSKHFCTIDINTCFGGTSANPPLNSTSEIFKLAAFEEPKCGDCIIAALLGQQPKGLEAFLPSQTDPLLPLSAAVDDLDTPVLPLTKTWQETDFSIAKVLPAHLTARDFATRLLLRYSYTMGDQKSRLILLHNEFEGRFELGRIKPDDSFWGLGKLVLPKNPSFLGINDDIEEDEDQLNTMLHGWFNVHWPHPLDWEA